MSKDSFDDGIMIDDINIDDIDIGNIPKETTEEKEQADSNENNKSDDLDQSIDDGSVETDNDQPIDSKPIDEKTDNLEKEEIDMKDSNDEVVDSVEDTDEVENAEVEAADNTEETEESNTQEKIQEEPTEDTLEAEKAEEIEEATEVVEQEADSLDSEDELPAENNFEADPEDWKRMIKLIEIQLSFAENNAEKSVLHYGAGEIYELAFGDTEKAIEHYQEAYKADQTHLPTLKASTRLFKEIGRWDMVVELLEAQEKTTLTDHEIINLLIEQAQIQFTHLENRSVSISLLEKILEKEPSNKTAFKLLEKIYTSGSKDEEGILVEFYKKYVDNPDFADLHLDLLQNLAQIQESHEHLEEEAIETYQKAIELDSENLLAIAALKRLLVKHDHWNKLGQVYSNEQEVTEDPRRKSLIKYLEARIAFDHQNDPDLAMKLLSEGLEIDPDNVLLLDELETVYANRREWGELARIHERQFNQAKDSEKKVELAFKIGALLEEHLQHYQGAAEWYEKALMSKPDYLPAMHVLGKMYARSGEYVKLIDILKREARLIEDDKLRAAKYFTIAEHSQHYLNDSEAAIEAYRQVLNILPGYLPAIKALSEIYAFLGRTDDLIEMNELQISNTANLNDEQFIYLLEKNASLHEYKGNFHDASNCHRRILEKRREYLPSIQSLGRLYAKAKRWEDLIEINQLEADLINDQHRIVSLLCRNGEIYETELTDEQKAIDYYRRVLTLSPTYMPAARALGAIYQRQENWDDLIMMHHRELEYAGEGEHATAIRYKIAQIYDEELGNNKKAEMNYKKILELDPSFSPALHSLTKLYQKANNHQALIEIYEGQIERSVDDSAKLLALYKVAELYESKLKQIDKSEAAFRKILDIDSDNLAAQRGLKRIYSLTGERDKQLELLIPEIEREQLPERRLPLIIAAADISNDLGHGDDETIALFYQVLNIDPDNKVAFQQLERLLAANNRFEDLANLYEARVDRIEDEKTKLSFLWLMVDLFENHLGDFDRLADTYAEIIRIEPYNSRALDFFEEAYSREKRWDELLEIYDRVRQLTEDKQRLLNIYLASGQILEFELGLPQKAIKKYESALSLDPKYFPAIQGARRVYSKLENWGSLVELLESELERAPSTGMYVSTAYQLGYVKETKFNQRKQACDLYMNVLDLDVTHKEAYVRAKKLLKEDRNFQQLIMLMEKRLATLESDDDKAKLHAKIADMAENELSDIAKAIEHRQILIDMNEGDITGKRHLAELLVKSSEWERAVALYEEIAPVLEDANELRDLYFQMGRIYKNELKDKSRAVSSFESVLSYEATDVRTMAELGELYKELRLSEEACEILGKLLENELPRDKEIHYNLSLGEIYLEQLEQEEESIKYFEKALALDPGHAEILDTLSDLFEKHNRWDRLVGLYESNIEKLEEDQIVQRVGLLTSLGRLHIDKIKDLDKALEYLNQAFELAPENTEILSSQAYAMGMNAIYYLDAIDKHRQLLIKNPFRVESYKELHRLFTERNEADRALCSVMALDFLRQAESDDIRQLHEMKEHQGGGIAAIIPGKDQSRLLIHENEHGVLRDILTHLEPTLYKLNEIDFDKYDLPNCKVAGVNSSIYHLMENSAYHLGVDLFKIYISQGAPDLLAIENTKPPTIILGGNLAFASEGIKRFLAGRIMSNIKNGHTMFVSEDKAKLKFWVEAACHLYVPEIMPKSTNIDEFEEFSANLNKSLSKSARKELEASSKQYHKMADKPSFSRYQLAMNHSANRMGLLLAGDIVAAIECLVFLDTKQPYRPSTSTDEVIKEFKENEQVKELLKFCVSEEFFELRKIIRINID